MCDAVLTNWDLAPASLGMTLCCDIGPSCTTQPLSTIGDTAANGLGHVRELQPSASCPLGPRRLPTSTSAFLRSRSTCHGLSHLRWSVISDRRCCTQENKGKHNNAKCSPFVSGERKRETDRNNNTTTTRNSRHATVGNDHTTTTRERGEKNVRKK